MSLHQYEVDFSQLLAKRFTFIKVNHILLSPTYHLFICLHYAIFFLQALAKAE